MSREALAKNTVGKGWSSTPGLAGHERVVKAGDGSERIGERWTPDHDYGRLRVHNVRSPVIQPKLKMSAPGDKYEQEADSVADKVMRMPDSQVQNQREPSGIPRNARKLQSYLGQPLDPATRNFMESRLGHDLGDVRIHIHGQAAASAQAIGARAYTVGRDVVFRPGQYAPNTQAGRRLLAHELTHVVQQSPAKGETRRMGISKGAAPMIQRQTDVGTTRSPRPAAQSRSASVKRRFLDANAAPDVIAQQFNDRLHSVEPESRSHLELIMEFNRLPKATQRKVLFELEAMVPTEQKLQRALETGAKIDEISAITRAATAMKRVFKASRKLKRVDDSPRAYVERALTGVGTFAEETFHEPFEEGLESLKGKTIETAIHVIRKAQSAVSSQIRERWGSDENTEAFINGFEIISDILLKAIIVWASAGSSLWKGLSKVVDETRKFFLKIPSALFALLDALSGNPEKFNEVLGAIREGLVNLIPNIETLANKWHADFKTASELKRAEMIGDLIGDIAAEVLGFIGGGGVGKAAGGAAGKVGGKVYVVAEKKASKLAKPLPTPQAAMAGGPPLGQPLAFSKSAKKLKAVTGGTPKTGTKLGAEDSRPTGKRRPKETEGPPSKPKQLGEQIGGHVGGATVAFRGATAPKGDEIFKARKTGSDLSNAQPASAPASAARATEPEFLRIASAEDFSNRYPRRIRFERDGRKEFEAAFGKGLPSNVRGARGELLEALRLLERGHPVHGPVDEIIVLRARRGKKGEKVRTPDFAVKYRGRSDYLRIEITSTAAGRSSTADDLISSLNVKGTTRKGTREKIQVSSELNIPEGAVLQGDTVVINAFKGTEPGAIAEAVAKKGPQLVPEIKFIQFNRPRTGGGKRRPAPLMDLETIVYKRDADGVFRPLDPKHAGQ